MPRLVDVGIAAIIIGVGYAAGHYVMEQAREEGRSEVRAEVTRLEDALAGERADRARAEAAEGAYRAEMAALAARRPAANPVRLCVSPTPVPTRDPARGADDPAAAARLDDDRPGGDPAPGPDIGPELYALAASCDAEIARLRALQGWVRDDVR